MPCAEIKSWTLDGPSHPGVPAFVSSKTQPKRLLKEKPIPAHHGTKAFATRAKGQS